MNPAEALWPPSAKAIASIRCNLLLTPLMVLRLLISAGMPTVLP
ncbi:MAG: hypothetical protein WDO68_01765 [Gammaproteobacteria bacterium]